MDLHIQWLGAAGLEFQFEQHVLLVDPFFTRPSLAKLLSLRGVQPDAELIRRHAAKADSIFITHAHYDHLMDVPEIMRTTGAKAYGSTNTCELLALHGLQPDRCTCIEPGTTTAAGPFTVDVYPGKHTRTPIDPWINGKISPGLKIRQPPFRPIDFRMDTDYSFRIRAGDIIVLVGNYPVKADILIISPFHSVEEMQSILQTVRPDRVVPIHWDNFLQPLSRPLQPMLVTSWQGWGGWPPVRRLNLQEYSRRIEMIHPKTQVILPEIFKEIAYGSH